MISNRALVRVAPFLVGLVFAQTAIAEDFTVGQGGLATIQAAVDAALSNNKPDDNILVPAGTYLESVFISFASLTGTNLQERLTLKRTGQGQVLIQGSTGLPALYLSNVENVSVKKLTVDSGDSTDSVPALAIDGMSVNVAVTDVNGMPGDDYGVLVVGSSDMKAPTTVGVYFEDCDFSGMLKKGFWVNGIGHGLKECTANGCGENGIVVDEHSANFTLDRCTAVASLGQDSTNFGYITVRGTGHHVTRAVVSGAGIHGFQISGSGHHFEQCESTGNANAGYLVSSASVQLDECEASDNLFGLKGGGEGLSILRGKYSNNSSHGLGFTAGGGRLRAVTANGNGGHGVYLLPGADGMVIASCAMKNNGGEGVQVESDLNWLEENKAKKGDGLVDLGSNNGGRNNTVKNEGTNDF